MSEAPKANQELDQAINNLSIDKEGQEKVVTRLDASRLLIDGVAYQIAMNYREVLDIEDLNQRYSDIFEKYEYIVGDYSRNQLRLRGFYEDETQQVPIDMHISFLDEYLNEYCSFGCGYFVLKRLEPTKNFTPYQKSKQDTGGSHKHSKKKYKSRKKHTEPKKRKNKSHSKKAPGFIKKEKKIQVPPPTTSKNNNEDKARQGKKFTIRER